MNKIQLLFILSKTKNPFKLRMRGSSMGPILHDGDTIVVCQKATPSETSSCIDTKKTNY